MSDKFSFSRFWCPKDFHHIVGMAVCRACEIPSALCRVKRLMKVVSSV